MFFTKKSWICIITFLYSLFLLLEEENVLAQNSGTKSSEFEVSGIVRDASGIPIEGAFVYIPKKNTGVSTSPDGKFSLFVEINDILKISMLGFVEKTIQIENRLPINVELLESRTMMEESVVIGYGTVARKDHTGAVASVNSKQLENKFYTSTAQMLQGMVAGVNVTETSSEPGGVSSIRIRGTNSIYSNNEPLYVVDGYVGANVDGIGPNDVQSIEVLKDASATAIYGSRGANGVIIITTKQGLIGKPVVSYDLKYGLSEVSKKMEMADAYEYGQFLLQGGQAVDLLSWKTKEEWDNIGKGTDWQDEIFQLGQYQNHQLSVRGGSKTNLYAVSGNLIHQKGNVINSDLTKFSLRTNLSINLAKSVKLMVNANLVTSKGNRATINTAGTPQDGATVLNALRMAPFIPVYNDDGSYYPTNDFPTNGDNGNNAIIIIGNPVAYANEVRNSLTSIMSSSNAILQIELLKGLTWRSSLGSTILKNEKDDYVPKMIYEGRLKNGQGNTARNGASNLLTEHTLTYKANLKNIHKLDAVAGFTYQSFNNKDMNLITRDYFSDMNNGFNISDAGTASGYSSNYAQSSIVSFLARVNYSFKSRYIFTLTGRADGSSKFSKNNKWGYFPAAAFAWNVNEEPFLKHSKWINVLKLRFSWGISGNQDIGNYKSQYLYSTGKYQFNSVDNAISLRPIQLGNDALEWEKTMSYNAGVDFNAFKNRIQLTADVYYKKTYDMLSEKKLPESSGFASVMVNIGDVENKGIEISLLSRNIVSQKKDGFYWETRLTFAANRNKILRLGENNEDIYVGTSSNNLPSVGSTSILRVGEPIGAFFGCIYDGVWRDYDEINLAVANGMKDKNVPGDPKWIDQNGDGYINAQDRVINGYAYPKFTASINNTLSYKNFSLDIFIYGSYGNNVLNLNRYYMEGFSQYNKSKYYLENRWTEDNIDGTLPRFNTPKVRHTPGAASLYVEDASFLRLKTITLGYKFPNSVLKKTFIKSLKLYFTGDNLYTLTKYSGYDPEVNSFGQNNTSLATDRGAYPKYRTYIMGVSISF